MVGDGLLPGGCLAVGVPVVGDCPLPGVVRGGGGPGGGNWPPPRGGVWWWCSGGRGMFPPWCVCVVCGFGVDVGE